MTSQNSSYSTSSKVQRLITDTYDFGSDIEFSDGEMINQKNEICDPIEINQDNELTSFYKNDVEEDDVSMNSK